MQQQLANIMLFLGKSTPSSSTLQKLLNSIKIPKKISLLACVIKSADRLLFSIQGVFSKILRARLIMFLEI